MRYISLILFILFLPICGCSDDRNQSEDHVLKEKMEAVKKVEAVNQLVEDAAKKQRQEIYDQSH